MKRTLVIALLALTAATFNARAVTTELALLIDGSGSISSGDFTLQKNGYATGLAAEVPTDGSVAIGVWQFSSTVQSVFATTVINSVATLNSLIAAINGMTQLNSNTAIGDAIAAASADLNNANGITSTRQVIDVSTDGVGNVGVNQVTARNAALANGIDQINGLLVGSASSSSFVGGVDSFTITATSFAQFDAAIKQKLHTEITGAPDAGSTVVLMSLGLMGLMGYRRYARLA